MRYLRNCIMAKISGLTEEQNTSELLQISPDERRRAVRSAMLFTEEELTRFLQVMLRTFDDLGYRQEQRLHLELGLIKLVHLQRLMPMEEFLSQLPKPAAGSAGPRTTPPPAPRPSTPSAPSPSRQAPTPAPSRFSGGSGAEMASPFAPRVPAQSQAQSQAMVRPIAQETPAQLSPLPVAMPTEVATIAPLLPEQPIQTAPFEHSAVVLPSLSASELEELPSVDVEATEPQAPTPLSPAADLQAAAIEALFATGKHSSAAEQLETSTWTLHEGELRIATSLSKPMIAMIFRADVEAIIKTALRERGLPGVRLAFEPGALDTKPKAPRKPRTGSAQARALEHPTVQAAQKLFNAEITNVFDLRKD